MRRLRTRFSSGPPVLLLSSCFPTRDAVVDWLCTGITLLEPCVRPSHFGDTENARRTAKNSLDDEARFEEFIGAHPGGFFLYGEGFKINVDLSNLDYRSCLDWWIPLKNRIALAACDHILDQCGQYGAIYGYAADFEEIEYRHRVIVEVAGAPAMSWFGRDYLKYVPGLYWMNYFSSWYLQRNNIAPRQIAETLQADVRELDHGILLRLYDSAGDWRQRKDAVGEVIDRLPQIFSRRVVTIPESLPLREYDQWSHELFRNWP